MKRYVLRYSFLYIEYKFGNVVEIKIMKSFIIFSWELRIHGFLPSLSSPHAFSGFRTYFWKVFSIMENKEFMYLLCLVWCFKIWGYLSSSRIESSYITPQVIDFELSMNIMLPNKVFLYISKGWESMEGNESFYIISSSFWTSWLW